MLLAVPVDAHSKILKKPPQIENRWRTKYLVPVNTSEEYYALYPPITVLCCSFTHIHSSNKREQRRHNLQANYKKIQGQIGRIMPIMPENVEGIPVLGIPSSREAFGRARSPIEQTPSPMHTLAGV